MNTKGFSLIEILVALTLLSAFMLGSFAVLKHFNVLEQGIAQELQHLR